MKYSLILLDADGTLFDFDKAEAIALKKVFKYYGLKYDEDILLKYREISMHIWVAFEQGRVNLDSLQKDRFEKLFKEIDVFTDPSTFNETYLDCLAEENFLNDGAIELCQELSTSCTLAIATNGISRTQKKRLENSQIAPYISYIFVSEDTGYQKPHSGFFDYVFRACGHTNTKTAIILGDSLRTDIKGGSDYGIATCWYNPSRVKLPSDSLQPDFEIRKLTDFATVINV